MSSRFLQPFIALTLALMCFSFSFAQSADNQNPLISKPADSNDDRPKSFKETMEKMRIDKEKKEYKEMLDRGEEVLKLAEELEKAAEQNGKLNEQELAKVTSVEKLVKKIRTELGGDDEDDKDDQPTAQKSRLSRVDAIKTLRTATVALFDELKKTTRFSISAAAIQSTNAVLRIARFLRFAN